MIKTIQNFMNLLHNKIYADILRSKWYAHQVENNPHLAVNIKWQANHHKSFPWSNPQTLDEKITWLQVNTDTSTWSLLSDKYEVRKYVGKLIGEEYLIPCYGVWENVEDIDFEKLPNQFVIKCTHDCGSTIIVDNKQEENLEELKKTIKKFQGRRMGYTTFEPHYLNIKPRIIAEKLIQQESTNRSLIDYKIWCLDGEPFMCLVCYDRHHHQATWETYQLEPWCPRHDWLSEREKKQKFKTIPTPKNLTKMIDIAKTLSCKFPQVRLDLYNINGDIYFGEMTFTACSVNQMSYSKDVLYEMGKRITLPTNKQNAEH